MSKTSLLHLETGMNRKARAGKEKQLLALELGRCRCSSLLEVDSRRIRPHHLLGSSPSKLNSNRTEAGGLTIALPIFARIGNVDTLKTEHVKIDRFGRVLIPKKVRERLGIEVGQAFELSVEGQKVMLEPQVQGNALVRKGNIVVFEGELPKGDVDWVRAVRDQRDSAILEIDSF